MTKIVFESGLVINLGGYFVERVVKSDFIDVVVGNPLDEDVKIDLPILSMEMLDGIRDKGLLVEYLYEGDSLKDKLEEMREKVKP